MFSNGACYRQESAKGERHGFARRPQRHAERPARAKHAEFTILIQRQQSGHGDAANTWVGKGENKAIAPGDLANALGADQIESLSAQSGLSRDELLSGLSQYLPQVVDHLTPDGRLPTEQEIAGR